MNKNDIFTMLIGHIREVVPELEDHSFQNSDSLSDLGADSVDRSEITVMALESLNLNIPAVEMYGPQNIGELVDALFNKYTELQTA